MINWKVEKDRIRDGALRFHIDPAFLATIREVEDGRPGREFGVLSESAPDYASQMKIAAETISHRLSSFPSNPLSRNALGRVVYRETWIAYFASIWCPIGANNDPNGLNRNWLTNAKAAYPRLVEMFG